MLCRVNDRVTPDSMFSVVPWKSGVPARMCPAGTPPFRVSGKQFRGMPGCKAACAVVLFGST